MEMILVGKIVEYVHCFFCCFPALLAPEDQVDPQVQSRGDFLRFHCLTMAHYEAVGVTLLLRKPEWQLNVINSLLVLTHAEVLVVQVQ